MYLLEIDVSSVAVMSSGCVCGTCERVGGWVGGVHVYQHRAE
jgi:hypothetical protein